jgi:hypothetical protein
VRVEQLRQVRQIQNLANVFRYVAQLEVAVRLADAGQCSHHGAEPAAVDECDVGEVQHDGAAVMQQPGNVGAQSLALAAGNNPSVAAHDGDAAHLTSVER